MTFHQKDVKIQRKKLVLTLPTDTLSFSMRYRSI